jgi:hypothetical protein
MFTCRSGFSRGPAAGPNPAILGSHASPAIQHPTRHLRRPEGIGPEGPRTSVARSPVGAASAAIPPRDPTARSNARTPHRRSHASRAISGGRKASGLKALLRGRTFTCRSGFSRDPAARSNPAIPGSHAAPAIQHLTRHLRQPEGIGPKGPPTSVGCSPVGAASAAIPDPQKKCDAVHVA